MKLARKLAIALILGVFAVVAVHAYFRVRRLVALFETDIRHDSHAYGRALAGAVAAVVHADGRERARAIVELANQRENHVRIRWVSLDAPAESPDAPAAPRVVLDPVANGEELVLRLPRLDDVHEEHLVTFVPVVAEGGGSLGAIELAESLAGEKQYVRTALFNTFLANLAVALVCGLIATGLGVWFVGRPMQSLIAQARRVGAGDLSARLRLSQRDEIGQLAHEMNLMCDRLAEANARAARETEARIAALEQLRHADRLATVGKLAAGIAHELGAPLQVISGRARMLCEDGTSPGEVENDARIIAEQTDRIIRIVRQLLDFARRRGAEKSRTDLRGVTRRTLSLLGPLADKRNVSIEIAAGEAPIEADVDAAQIQQALTNLVVNGIQAMKAGGKLCVEVHEERAAPPHDIGGDEAMYACIEVRDEGEGMPSDVVAHIFEPFYTTKDVGEGTGLGLSVSYGIVREHEGFIRVDSEVGKGSRFRVYLPSCSRASPGVS
ncbi:HAMP domain-containing sensor histidine kinase [Polyangium sp. y55x31]|uniref:sensor histidine kinase n=1 Tax=Polyangium sp. y55x31 TaxID=3042688 RepID=UPI00248328A9|nr:HAMP domain-containing sensor histidine kinase [Polyangium sp. y55x31]MDI1480701.1 ATP-binding protein [Polyangium sp. y55x31]